MSVYSCPSCGRRYTVTVPGDYYCDCGAAFNCPYVDPVEELESSPDTVEPEREMLLRVPDKVQSTKKGRKKRKKFIPHQECPYARAALICAILGIPFTLVFSLAGLTLAIMSRSMQSDPRSHYDGAGLTLLSLGLSIFGIVVWGVVFVAVMAR